MRLLQCAPLALAAALLPLAACAEGTPANGGSSTGSAAISTVAPDPGRAIVPAATSSPVLPGPAVFTFPDGRLSFSHPADWTVELFEPSKTPYVGTATVHDAEGSSRINIYYGQIADVVAGSATRTVIETDPVLGLRDHSVPTPHASFFVDRSEGAARYRMELTAGLPVSPDGQVREGPVLLGDRVLSADVLFDAQPFANDDAAKAWFWGAEGQALKAVLMSFSYR
ncbi:hypothetical protein J2T22_002653 [Pseudarthrobacter defluvii]|uniref:Uncharacterized protein n=1 Tax=Pseudarthrobacter defluvii TaxID=410837 RepID=A0ABT9UII3_9MICC|nr:hypothetical protein [Pseudarthrobacter defluvii]MDQ0119458.1 hypothetical protein [Pseudarthrobacter defluvii]